MGCCTVTIHVSELPCCMPNQVIGVAVILHTIVFNIVLPKEEQKRWSFVLEDYPLKNIYTWWRIETLQKSLVCSKIAQNIRSQISTPYELTQSLALETGCSRSRLTSRNSKHYSQTRGAQYLHIFIGDGVTSFACSIVPRRIFCCLGMGTVRDSRPLLGMHEIEGS